MGNLIAQMFDAFGIFALVAANGHHEVGLAIEGGDMKIAFSRRIGNVAEETGLGGFLGHLGIDCSHISGGKDEEGPSQIAGLIGAWSPFDGGGLDKLSQEWRNGWADQAHPRVRSQQPSHLALANWTATDDHGRMFSETISKDGSRIFCVNVGSFNSKTC